MKSKAKLIDSIYKLIVSNPEAMSMIGNFAEDVPAIAYESINEAYTLPNSSNFIVYNIEGTVAKAAESITVLETVQVKFYVSGQTNIELSEAIIDIYNGIELEGYRATYTGSIAIPETQTNQIPATNVRFEFI